MLMLFFTSKFVNIGVRDSPSLSQNEVGQKIVGNNFKKKTYAVQCPTVKLSAEAFRKNDPRVLQNKYSNNC